MSDGSIIEEWRAMPEWEGLYEVSSAGRVRSLDRIVAGVSGNNHDVPITLMRRGREIQASPDWTKRYVAVRLKRGQKKACILVHRAVLSAFVRPFEPGEQGNHKDGNGLNNCLSNLEIVTKSQNIRHGIDVLGHVPGGKGERHWSAKLTPSQVLEIMDRLRTTKYGDVARMAREFGVANQSISAIKHGFHWKHLRQSS